MELNSEKNLRVNFSKTKPKLKIGKIFIYFLFFSDYQSLN